MSPFLRLPNRSLMTTVSVIACIATLLCAPRTAGAQSGNGSDASDTQDTTAKTRTDKPQTDRTTAPNRSSRPKTYVPPPGNPLVKINPNDGSGNDIRDYNKDGTRKQPRRWTPADDGDYQADAEDPRFGQRARSLPIFGYDTFAWPRQYRNAQRASLLRRYPGLFADEDQQTSGKRLRRSSNGSNGDTNRNGTTSRRTRGANSGDDTDTTTDATGRPRKRPNRTDNADDNADNGASADRGTRSTSDDTTDDASTRPRRTRSAGDQSDDTDQADNTDTQTGRSGSQRNAGAYRDTRNTDNTGDNGDDMSTDEAIRQQDLQIENLHRRQLGLPPRTDDTADPDQEDARNATGRLNSTGSNRNARSARSGRNGGNTTDDGYASSRNADSTLNRDASQEPIDAYSQVADPLSQLTRNITASPPANYQISGGDKLVIRYSNPAMAPREITRTVDSQGNLVLDEIGHINVAGLSLDQVQEAIKKRLERLYKRPDVNVNLKELRTIAVTVAGKAFLTGTYNVPAAATAFNVLYVAGGPTREGSMRSIEIRRQNKIVTLDLYKTMMVAASQKSGNAPNYQADIPLQSGDVIYVPTYHQRVAVQGEVREPALFELKEGETLQDVLTYAGGIKASGISQHVQVNTVEPGSARVIKDVNLKDAATAGKVALYDGDVVNVLALRPIVANKVTIDGAVQEPSDYALTPNMRVADLVRAANNPLGDAFLGHAALYRWNPNGTTTLIPINLAKALDGDPEDNQPLMKWDRLEVYSKQEAFFTGNHFIVVRGAVQRKGTYSYADNMHVSDLLYKVGGPLPDAEMVVVEHQHGDGTKQYETVSVADITHGNKARDIKVEDNDIVAVYRNGETGFIPDHKVMIEGFVQTPGLYDRGEGMKLSDLVKLAGDFKPDAGEKVVVVHARRPVDGPDADFRTVAVLFDSQHRCAPQDDVRLQDGDRVLIQGKGGFEDRPAVVTIGGAVNKPGPYPVTSKKMRLSDLIAQAGGLRKEAFPQGAQFKRDPKLLASDEQRTMARIISDFSDLNNASAFKREQAKDDLARIQASGAAAQGSILAPGGGSQPNPAAAAIALELSKHSTVTPARSLTSTDLEPTGNIAVNLPGAMLKPGGPDDVLLLDGDNVFIPVTPTTVYVEGGVVNPRGVLYKQGEPLSYYISQAGGYAPDAAKDRIVVIHAGGGLTPANQVRTLRVGDMIIVPLRVMAEKLPNPNSGASGFFSQLLGGALVFRLLGL